MKTHTCRMEHLEGRMLFAGYAAATVPELIAAMNAANASAEDDTISLAAGASFSLTAVDNTSHGPTGLPVVTAGGGALAITGNGATIGRPRFTGISFTPAFRLFDVAAGASLTLGNITLQGGLAGSQMVTGLDGHADAWGAAVHNLGAVTLDAVTVLDNQTRGQAGYSQAGTPGRVGLGGGIYSAGALTMTGCTVRNNLAYGGWGADAFAWGGVSNSAAPGGDGAGGGVYIAGGSAAITRTTFSSNTARGGKGGDGMESLPKAAAGGNGLGGGLFAAAGAVTVRSSTFTLNDATGTTGGLSYSRKSGGKLYAPSGRGIGGGIYIATKGVTASLDAFTVRNTAGNTSTTSDPDIFGRYTRIV